MLDVGYVYQDLQRLREEEKEEEVDTTLEYDSEALPLIDATIAGEWHFPLTINTLKLMVG